MPEERTEDPSYDRAHRRARKRVEELVGFYTHVLTYLVVIGGLFVINMLTSPEVHWFWYPLIGWGVFVLIHGATLYLGGPFGQKWQERKTQELMEKDRDRSGGWGPRPPLPQP